MAKGLEALLGATIDVQKPVYMARLKTEFTVKALSNEEMRSINMRATTVNGKGEKKTDDQLLNALFIAKGCVDPDFNDKALKTHYGASDEADCVAKALLPGEIAKLVTAILELSGFGDDEEMIEDAKN